jgi:PPOX class probable F420-dependent enzyme
MPKGRVPAQYHDILESTTLGHLATLDAEGLPQVNPVWFLWDGQHILISIKANTQKYRNLRRNPRLALSFHDLTQRERYVEIRGEVIEFELYEDLTFVNQLARKYTRADFQHGYPGEHRYKLTIQINGWTGQG